MGDTNVNLYAYVSGNPITRIDPSGLSWLDCGCRDPEKKCETSQYSNLEKCEAVKQRGFIYSSSDAALKRMKIELGVKDLTKHNITKAHSTGGTHINVRWHGEKMGTLLSIYCCDDSCGKATKRELWRIKRNYSF